MRKKTKYITAEDRYRIESLWKVGKSAKDIAALIGVSYAALMRELERGYDGTALGYGRTGYSADLAELDALKKQAIKDAARKKSRKRHLVAS